MRGQLVTPIPQEILLTEPFALLLSDGLSWLYHRFGGVMGFSFSDLPRGLFRKAPMRIAPFGHIEL